MTDPFPIEITFRNMDQSEALAAEARQRAGRLANIWSEIISCRIVCEVTQRSQTEPVARFFLFRIDVAVPDEDIHASNDPHDDATVRDPYLAMREAFDAAERQLKGRVGRLRDRKAAQPD